MEFYFYCSYEHSVRGFFPVCVQEDKILPCDGSAGVSLPSQVWDFFSYDRFKLLWREYPSENGGKLFPEPEKSLFGIRVLHGNMGTKKGIVNFAVMAEEDELARMEKLATAILFRYDEFVSMLFSFLSVGGEYGYCIDIKRFFAYIEEIEQNPLPDDVSDKKERINYVKTIKNRTGILTERDLLRFGVRTDAWKSIAQAMGDKLLWSFCPKTVIDTKKFDSIFNQE